MKLIWKVGEAPTGRYRSFFKRSWPLAYFDKAKNFPAASISHAESYTAALAKADDIGEIEIRVAIPKGTSWDWARLKARAKNLDEAKKLAADFFERHPEYVRGS